MTKRGEPATFYDVDLDNIPERPGLYAFYLNVMAPQKVGLVGNRPALPAEKDVVDVNIIKRLDRAFRLFRGQTYKGTIGSGQRGRHVAHQLTVSALEEVPTEIIDEAADLDADDQLIYLQYASGFATFLHPIYVGITVEQTLKTRYVQHRQSFERPEGGQSDFGSRVKASGFDWDDLVFSCVPFDGGGDPRKVLRLLEKQLQAFARPAFSSQ